MKKKFTKKYILENSGCYDSEDVQKYWPEGVKSITLLDILKSEIKLKDKYWFVCKKLLTKKQSVAISVGVSEIVLHLFENKYPEDERPRKAIEAAKKYLNLRNADTAYAAASAAAAYADASAVSAFAAADTAYAASAAAYAAAAAAAASAASASADNKTKLTKSLEIYLLKFCGYGEN